MRIIDMHCDTLMEGFRHPQRSFYDGETSINLKLLKENDSLAQFFAIYLPRDEMETMDPYDLFNAMYDYYTRVMEENKDVIRPVFNTEDIEKNREEGFLSSFLTIEDGVFLDGKIERVQEVYDKGVRLITLLWNFENSAGYPTSDDPQEHMRGLKPFGEEVVAKMNELGMIIDHLVYMKDKAGIDALGFGSDFDGIEDNGELVNYSGFTRLLSAMEKKFTDDEIDKICSLNALRIIKDVTGK